MSDKPKTPEYNKWDWEDLDYKVDLSYWLEDTTITSAEVVNNNNDLTIALVETNSKNVIVWVTGGVSGQSYTVYVDMQTSGASRPRKKRQAIIFNIN